MADAQVGFDQWPDLPKAWFGSMPQHENKSAEFGTLSPRPESWFEVVYSRVMAIGVEPCFERGGNIHYSFNEWGPRSPKYHTMLTSSTFRKSLQR